MVDERKPASGEKQPQHEEPFRRAFAWPILWGPWVTSVIGIVVLGFGLLINGHLRFGSRRSSSARLSSSARR